MRKKKKEIAEEGFFRRAKFFQKVLGEFIQKRKKEKNDRNRK